MKKSKDGDVTDEDDVDLDAYARLQTVTLGMKQQADELLMAGQLDKALTLYRELLMHLTRSQVTLLQQRELVVSCRMNILAVLSKNKSWSSVVAEAAETLAMLAELEGAKQPPHTTKEEQTHQSQVLTRAYYFRGFAYLKLGLFQPSRQDFHRAMELNPEDETIQTDYKELQTALQAEQRVKQFLGTSMKLFQAGKYPSAVEACLSALRESQLLQKTELTGLIHGNLAAIYVKMKDDAKAIAHYKRTMLLTRCGGEPTSAQTAQNERVFDILDSLAGCYSRKRDYSSALSVIEDQIKLFPECPERKEHEAMMYLNCGRICYYVGRYTEAQEHLEKGCSEANKAPNQLDVALNCAFWLSKACVKNSKAEQAMATLDGTGGGHCEHHRASGQARVGQGGSAGPRD
jgi:tetratricopeptide (TPR) repeat protein